MLQEVPGSGKVRPCHAVKAAAGVFASRVEMNWFTGVVLFVVIWWTALFAVLPVGVKPVERPDDVSGWRGAPARPAILKKVIVTTVVSCILWTGSYLLLQSDIISFRHGFFAEPDD